MRPIGGGATTRSSTPQPAQDQAPFGDILQDNTGTKFRIVLWNPGGFPVSRKSGKSKVIEEAIRMLQADVICLTETDVNWNKVNVHNRLHERFLGWWQRMSLNIAHYGAAPPKRLLSTSAHQYGGVAICSVNDGASRVVSAGQDPTGLGRWAWTKYQGKEGHALRVVTAYRCNRPTAYAGSVYNQQKAYFEARDDDRNPRDAFWEDLVTEIQPWLVTHTESESAEDQGRTHSRRGRDHVIVGMDMNEDVRDPTAVRHFRKLGLTEIITHRHGKLGPRTCTKGSTPIDGIFVSPGLLESTCGYLPVAHDHRRLWIDLDIESVFGVEADIAPRFKPQRLKNSDRRCTDKYLHDLNQLFFEESEFAQRLDNLFHGVRPDTPLTCEQAAEFDYLVHYHDQAAKWAEKGCRKLRMGQQAWTPQYTQNRNTRLFWLRLLAKRQGKWVNSRYLQRLAKQAHILQPLRTLTESQARQGLKSANAVCAAYAKRADLERDQYMTAWGAAEEEALHIPAAKAIARRLANEKARREGRIISFTLGKSRGGGVQTALRETPTGPQECTSKLTTEQAFLEESSARFRQAGNTPALTSLLTSLGKHGFTDDAERILAGSFIPPPEVDYWTTEWLAEMKRPLNYEPMRADRTLDDFASGWKKSKERTSSSPFGLRFTHYKTHASDPRLSTLDFQLASIPLVTGYSPIHWQQGMNAWLLKKPDEFRIKKMRTILLYDASFNQNNKWFGRATMHHAERLQRSAVTPSLQALAPEQFGSRKKHQAIDQCLNKRLTFDLSRQLHCPMALCANDAKSCYDRIVHSVASLCLQRIGCPKPAIHSMFETLQHLRHHVRTRYGDSMLSYNAADAVLPIQGLGQGNGAGPTIWALISTPVLNLLRSHGFGIKITSCMSGDFLHFVGYCFVDDTDLVEFPDVVTSAVSVGGSLQQAVDAWEAGIRATGGAIVPDKSHWYLISYRWEGGTWRYARTVETPFELTVRDEFGTRQSLTRMTATDAERTLGARIAPNGSCDKEKQYLRDCATAWADHIRTGRLPRSLSWKALLTTIMRKLLYPVPVTYFTRKDCDYIMAPVLRVALSYSGVCRTIPRVLVYAPLQFQGLAVPDLYIEQGFSKLVRLLRYGRKSISITSNLMRQSGEAMKMEFGRNGFLMQHDYSLFNGIISPSWMKETWRFLFEHDICVKDDLPLFRSLRHHDTLLMEEVSKMGLSAADLYKVNTYRLHLQVVTLSDMVDGSGEHITVQSWKGTRSVTHSAQYTWGVQPRPPATFLSVWQRVLSALCGRARRLRQPLGNWNADACDKWIWWYDELTESLFSRHNTGSVEYTEKSSRPTRQAVLRFTERITSPQAIPASATPCTVIRQGQFLLFQGTAPLYREPQITTLPLQSSFHDYTRSLTLNAWVFDCVQFQGSIESIVESIRHGTCSCITDGSFKDHHGTAAWKIIDLAKPDHVMEGQVVTPGFPYQQDAYRSELSGLYASVTAINALTSFFQLDSGSITLACDNMSADRMTSYDATGTNPSSCAQYDLVMAVQYIKTPILQWIHQHVKGHQDDHPDLILTPIELINVEMDTKAKQHWETTHLMLEVDRIHHFVGQPWAVSLGGHKVVSQLSDSCKEWCQRPRIQAYWIKKGRFPSDELDKIEFTTAGEALRLEPSHTRRWVTKLSSGYCGVNKWMNRWKKRDSAACPRCTHMVEDVQHLWLCQGKDSPTKWVMALKLLEKELQHLQTDPVLTKIIISRLCTWQTSANHIAFTSLPATYTATLQRQDAQGWCNFWMGLPSQGWQAIQAAHYLRIESPKTGSSWLIAIIRKQWLIAWSIWDYRNQVVHDKDEGTDIQRIANAIRAEYAEGIPSHDMKKFFRTPLRDRLRHTSDSQANWLHRVRESRARTHRKDSSLRRTQACMAAFLGQR